MLEAIRYVPKPYNIKKIRAIVFSLLGMMLFSAPIYYKGVLSIPVAVLVNCLQASFHEQIKALVTFIICFTAAMPLVSWKRGTGLRANDSFVSSVLSPSIPTLLARVFGAAVVLMVYFDVGPECLLKETTGGLILNDVMPVVLLSLLISGLLLPLLLDFGLPEFFGGLLSGIMRPIFKLPKISAINCVASWFGDGSVGILMASQQYERGLYSQREAAIIGTSFSPVSITFSLVIISQVGLAQMFLPFYFTVCLAGLVTAFVVPRLPPLSLKPDDYIKDVNSAQTLKPMPVDLQIRNNTTRNESRHSGSKNALIKVFTRNSTQVMVMIIAVLPMAASAGTMALVLVEHTSLLAYLGIPLVPLLEMLRIPEATKASEAAVIGFVDMYLPSILVGGLGNEVTRFFAAALSVVQVIFISESGSLLIVSKIPIGIKDLILIFILRTLVSMPVVAIMAHLFC